jgi:hypothetical protein
MLQDVAGYGRRSNWRAAIVLAVLASPSAARAQSPRYQMIHEGRHWTWFARAGQFRTHRADIAALYDYADTAFDKLCESWGLKPPKDRYALLVMEDPGGGFAAGDISEVRAITGKKSPGIGCAYDAFSGTANGIKAYWAHILITHEMVNLLTGELVGGGWPVDWWADHRSPFPLMTAVEIEYALVPHMAVFHERQGHEDRLLVMFQQLKDQYGWAMFRKAFRTAIDDGIRWDALGGNPSALRTAYVAAYLQIGTPEDIGGILGPRVPGFDGQAVKDVVRARGRWAGLPRESPRRKALQAAFLKGDYKAALELRAE